MGKVARILGSQGISTGASESSECIRACLHAAVRPDGNSGCGFLQPRRSDYVIKLRPMCKSDWEFEEHNDKSESSLMRVLRRFTMGPGQI